MICITSWLSALASCNASRALIHPVIPHFASAILLFVVLCPTIRNKHGLFECSAKIVLGCEEILAPNTYGLCSTVLMSCLRPESVLGLHKHEQIFHRWLPNALGSWQRWVRWYMYRYISVMADLSPVHPGMCSRPDCTNRCYMWCSRCEDAWYCSQEHLNEVCALVDVLFGSN